MTAGEFAKDALIPGTQYRFVKTIGSGGHGTVIRVRHDFLERTCVMKLLHAELGDDADLTRRAIAEAKILAKIEHPNIVAVTDGGMTAERPSRPYFVMEELHGLSLWAMLQKLPIGLGFAQSVKITLGVLDGLDYAHTRHGIIHRDIKPPNIFLHRTATDTTQAKLVDFGIAHVRAQQHRHTGKHFLGTPRYGSPEQMLGETPTPQTDLYAVGLVLYECLTGKSPFAHLTDLGALAHAHINVKPRALREIMSGVPGDLDEMVACLLAKEPARRPESAAAAAVALRIIKERLDRELDGATSRVEFATEPTPMDNLLMTTVGGEGTNPPSAPALAGATDTVPGAPPFADVVDETEETGASAFSSTVPSPQAESRAAGARIDRAAQTRTRREPRPRQPTHDTPRLDDLAEDELRPSRAPLAVLAGRAQTSKTHLSQTPPPSSVSVARNHREEPPPVRRAMFARARARIPFVAFSLFACALGAAIVVTVRTRGGSVNRDQLRATSSETQSATTSSPSNSTLLLAGAQKPSPVVAAASVEHLGGTDGVRAIAGALPRPVAIVPADSAVVSKPVAPLRPAARPPRAAVPAPSAIGFE